MNKNVLVQLGNITKAFGDHVVLDHINLKVHKNEFLTLLGPSGCGKTTILRIIGGFEKPDSGQLLHNGMSIVNEPPYKRNINTVFQKYALFPHLNVFDNIAFGLSIKKMPKKEIEKKVKKVLKQVNLEGYEKRSINQISGGQQQRVAIARAIINEPEILLLDEPLGALDLKLRQEMQYELKTLQQELGITFIYVTHDQEEALTMSDTVVVLNNGVIQQMGTPEDIYNEPINAFVADFIGESNIYEGVMHEDKVVEMFGHNLTCVDVGFSRDEAVDIVIRPEDVVLKEASLGSIVGKVTDCIFKGVHYETCVEVDGQEWVVHHTKSYEQGEEVSIHVDPFNIHVMRKMKEEIGDEA